MLEGTQKGKVSSLEGPNDQNGNPTKARIVPGAMPDIVTGPLVIPWWLRGEMGGLKPESEVVFVLFPDQSGMILARADGERMGSLPGGLEVEGSITAEDFSTGAVASYNSHVHAGVTSGAGDTGKPK